MDDYQKNMEKIKLKEYNKAKYSEAVCNAAINGEKVPDALNHALHRICTICGIRSHDGFGEELRGILPDFTRALNARAIMSNRIPELEEPENRPYCIWYPEIPSESTCRQLVARYPHMAYQVARACAVGGYTALYKELDVLPEVHVADEARENGNLDIYHHIMSQPARYCIMNDYTRTIQSDRPQQADLNGDTAVRWMLEIKQIFTEPRRRLGAFVGGFEHTAFNITEDMNIASNDTPLKPAAFRKPKFDLASLMSSPLPRDLPTVDKDLMIEMAAYEGNVDRFVRLRRPVLPQPVLVCCVRGIRHSTTFAVWWSKQSLHELSYSFQLKFREAIDARFIMNNSLARVDRPDFSEPHLIWFPNFAHHRTYEKLAELKPSMIPQILRASIAAGNQYLFDQLLPATVPDDLLLETARHAPEPYYREQLAARVEQVGKKEVRESDKWMLTRDIDIQSNVHTDVWSHISEGIIHQDWPSYGVELCNAGAVELMMCIPEAWNPPEGTVEYLDYENWPEEFKTDENETET